MQLMSESSKLGSLNAKVRRCVGEVGAFCRYCLRRPNLDSTSPHVARFV